MIVVVLFVAALICFGWAAFASNQPARPSLVPLGLFCWLLAEVIAGDVLGGLG